MSSPIDLSRLPAPDVVEPLDYESILAERKAALIALYPEAEQADIAALLELESEPLTKLCEENAYRCLLYTSPSPRDLSTSRMPSSA